MSFPAAPLNLDLPSPELAVGTPGYVFVSPAPHHRRGVIQTVHHSPLPGGVTILNGYTVSHEGASPEDKRTYNWAPNELVALDVFEKVLAACDGDETDARVAIHQAIGRRVCGR